MIQGVDFVAQIGNLVGQVGNVGHGGSTLRERQRFGFEFLHDRESASKVLPVGQDVLAVSVIYIHFLNDGYAVDLETQFPVIITGFKLCRRGMPIRGWKPIHCY